MVNKIIHHSFVHTLTIRLSRKIHITAIASYKIYPAKMGGQKGIALFYQYLSQLLPVTIISTKNNGMPQNLSAAFLPILSNSRLRYINPFLFFRLKKIIQQNESSHLILEHPYYGWLGILLKKICKINLIVHSHNIEALRFKSTGHWWWSILWQYEKTTHRNADINFFISDEDREFAIKEFKLNETKCHTITYGIEFDIPPSSGERQAARKVLESAHEIDPDEHILFFNGTLDYKPNLDAVNNILDSINPLLLANTGFKYKIIICGKNLPAKYDELKNYRSKNIIYAGFVEDIQVYFKGTDVFLNPVTDGGGIKTKLVEALGSNLSAVSMKSGAIGVPQSVTGDKLAIVPDNDWKSFTDEIIKTDKKTAIPQAFFSRFYFGNIARKVAGILS